MKAAALAKSWKQVSAAQAIVPGVEGGGFQQDDQDEQDQQDIQDAQDGVGRGVVGFLPKAPKQTDRLLWALAREVKEDGRLLDEYCAIFDRWQAMSDSGFLTPGRDYLAEFLRKVGLVRFAKGATLLSAIHAAKKANPPDQVRRIKNSVAPLLASLCRELQRRAGVDKSFFLGSVAVGEALGVSHTTVLNWLGVFCGPMVGLLERTKQGSSTTGASEYRYLGRLD